MTYRLQDGCCFHKQIVEVATVTVRYRVFVDDGIFLVAEQLQRRRLERGWSAGDLARAAVEIAAEVGENLTLSQQAVSNFENKKLKATPRWLKFAEAALAINDAYPDHRIMVLADRFGGYRPLQTAPPAESLDPDPSWVQLRIPLPSERALAEMFEAQLRVFGDLQGAELARALAKRLPNALARAQSSLPPTEMAMPPTAEPNVSRPPPDRREDRQAQRT